MKCGKHLALIALATTLAANAWAGVPAAPVEGETPATVKDAIPYDDHNRSGGAADLKGALILGAEYLQAMQADVTDDNAGNGAGGAESPNDPDDGGWDWYVTSPPAPVHHTTAASPTNVYGVTALGLYYAYLVTGDAGYFTAMSDAAGVMIANANIRSGSDIVFLQLYDDLPGVFGTTYADAAKAKFDARIAFYGSATLLAQAIRDARHSQGYDNGIIAWDIAKWVLAAAMLDERYGGYADDADDMAEVLYQDSYADNLGYFDIEDDDGWDPTYTNKNYWWYCLGITGLITAFDAAGVHTDKLPDLADRLIDSQYPSGAVSGSYGHNAGDEDWQSTAYAAMALASYDYTGYRVDIVEMGSWLDDTQDTASTGGWRYTDNTHYPEIAGENTSALYFAYLAVNNVAADPTGVCISTVHTCETVPVTFTRVDTDEARGASVTIQLSGELELCGPITQGSWMSGEPNDHFEVHDNGGGSYTVDQALLGEPCGVVGGGVLFNVPVRKAPSVTTDATGTITVTQVMVRDCLNHPLPGIPGPVASISIDITPPAAVSNLAATQIKAGNDTDGTTKIDLTFAAPGDASVRKVYRKGFGHYPEYDDLGGMPPTPPTDPANAVANGWALTGVTVTGGDDEVAWPARDFWYYVIFTEDGCGNVSAVSNMTDGTLNYHLGDVTNGSTEGHGDNVVETIDVSLLGAHYGKTGALVDPVNYLDVGPTTDYSVDGLPTTDNVIGFEDLMMFAINYDQVGRGLPGGLSAENGTPVLVLEVDRLAAGAGDRLAAHLVLRGHDQTVKGLHAVVGYDASRLELADVARGELLNAQGGMVFFTSVPERGGVAVDAAMLGTEATLHGSGEIAELTFVVKAPGSAPRLVLGDLRDRDNRFLGDEPTPADDAEALAPVELPAELRLVGARPNPFGVSTDVVFRLPEAAEVSVRIYDVSGRLVRTLVERLVPAGEHAVAWDGRDTDGRRVAAGVYFTTFRAGAYEETQKLFRH
jgi:hypothetical protein